MSLINKLNEFVQIYITTRTHLIDKLQFQMSQLAYELNPFIREDQIDFIVKKLRRNSLISTIEVNTLNEFATKLVVLTADALERENNEDFIGIPLQCRILAECYEFKICELIQKFENDPLEFKKNLLSLSDGQIYDLSNLYDLLFETKKKILQQEKFKMDHFSITSQMFQDSYKRLENSLTKLALNTILQNQDQIIKLLTSTTNSRIFVDENEENNSLNNYGNLSGIVNRMDCDPWQFLHRTYAEHLMAKYIMDALAIDEKRYNRILDNEETIKWVVSRLLLKRVTQVS